MTDLLDILDLQRDKAFAQRVWNTNLGDYKNRLRAIGFTNQHSVLDAGCGMGQWTYALTELNQNVSAIEFDKNRFLFTKEKLKEMTVSNVDVTLGSVEELPYHDDSFDAIFSYSVILCTDYRKTLAEYYRVLKPGGKLYFNTNGLGWYLHNLINTHNDSSDFSSQEMAKVAIDTSLHYYATGEFIRRTFASVITPKLVVEADLKKLGFKNIVSSGEGTINLTQQSIKSFFKSEYIDMEGVTEYLCEK